MKHLTNNSESSSMIHKKHKYFFVSNLSCDFPYSYNSSLMKWLLTHQWIELFNPTLSKQHFVKVQIPLPQHPRFKFPLLPRSYGTKFKQELRVHYVHFRQLGIVNRSSSIVQISTNERNTISIHWLSLAYSIPWRSSLVSSPLNYDDI